jgi:alkylated DNA repair dioxygenase AlkB
VAEAEEGKHCQNYDNQPDEIDKTVHGFSSVRPAAISQATIFPNRQSSPRAKEKLASRNPWFSVNTLAPYLYLAGSIPISDPNCIPKDRGVTQQLALFPQDRTSPRGLGYAEEFIAPALERELIGRVSALPLQSFQFGAFEGKRRVASFGFRYDYTLQRLQAAEPIPDWLRPLIRQVEAHGGPSTRIAQVLCTEYDVGVGIGWHRDKPHFDRIFGLSLGSPCKFRFRRPVGEKWQRYTLEAAPRSLYMMSGESRRIWEHSIPAVEAPRYSITFRTMQDGKM